MLPPDEPLTIAIVDDHPVVIEGLQKILIRDLAIREVQEYHSGGDFIAYLKANRQPPDVVLLDISLPDANGVEICREIKTLAPDAYVLGFSNHNERSMIMQMLSNGASGYLLKNASATELVTCIKEVLNGQVAFSEAVKKIIARPSASQLKTIPPLTKRERQVLQMISDGKTNAEIAEELRLSLFTIETHRRNLMQKFDVKNAAALIKMAVLLQLV